MTGFVLETPPQKHDTQSFTVGTIHFSWGQPCTEIWWTCHQTRTVDMSSFQVPSVPQLDSGHPASELVLTDFYDLDFRVCYTHLQVPLERKRHSSSPCGSSVTRTCFKAFSWGLGIRFPSNWTRNESLASQPETLKNRPCFIPKRWISQNSPKMKCRLVKYDDSFR